PGLDWRYPRLGVLLLDEVSIESIVPDGQWTFSTLFAFGMRLGRYAALTADFADADEEARRLMLARVFWSEADIVAVLHEVAWRYQAAKEITEPPPVLPFGVYDSSKEIIDRIAEFAKWFRRAFIGPGTELMHAAFVTGFNSCRLFDPQFDSTGSDPNMVPVKEKAISQARDWLKRTAVSATGDSFNAAEIVAEMQGIFGNAIPLDEGRNAALAAIDALDETFLIDKLFERIPRLVDLWHPQLFHTLAPLSTTERDWDWFEDQIRQARARGVKYPCLVLSADGRISVGKLPDDFGALPTVSDPETQ